MNIETCMAFNPRVTSKHHIVYKKFSNTMLALANCGYVGYVTGITVEDVNAEKICTKCKKGPTYNVRFKMWSNWG